MALFGGPENTDERCFETLQWSQLQRLHDLDVRRNTCLARVMSVAIPAIIKRCRLQRAGETEDRPGCDGNLAAVLAPYGIGVDRIPIAFNIFMNVTVDTESGVGAIERAQG